MDILIVKGMMLFVLANLFIILIGMIFYGYYYVIRESIKLIRKLNEREDS